MSGNVFLRLLSQLVVFAGLGGYAMAASYYSSPCVDLNEIVGGSSGLSALAAKGGSYRVREIRWDQVLGRRWAMVASCEHPERPSFAVLTRGATAEKLSDRAKEDSAPLVRAGDVVRLWRQEESLRIEMTGMSEENGGLGKTIRIRLMGSSSEERQFVGIVRGVGDVEMQR